MNKRFKRFQKSIAVSLAALSCSGIETDAFSFRGMGKKISGKFSAIFHRPKKESVYCIDHDQKESKEPLQLHVATSKLYDLVTTYGLYSKDKEINKKLSIALENYAQKLYDIMKDPSLKTLLENCESDPFTLASVLIERDNRNELKNSTKRLMEWYQEYLDKHPDDEMSKYLTYQKYQLPFADEIRRIRPVPTINEEEAIKNLQTIKVDQSRMGGDKNAEKWLEFLKKPVSEGYLPYSQGVGWLLSHYFGEEHAPSAEDAETVIELINIYENFITSLSNKNLMEAVKSTYIEPLSIKQVRDCIYSYMILKETWMASEKTLIENTFKDKKTDVTYKNLKERKEQLFSLLYYTVPRLLTHENGYQLRRHINTTLRKLTGEYKDATATTITFMLFESITNFFLDPMKDPTQA